jgi:hypothetical protein
VVRKEVSVPLADVGRCHWAKALLTTARLPATARNITTFVAWAIAEGGWWNNRALYNPLNTTQPYNGSHAVNSVGVQAYRSQSDGMAATLETLHNGNYGAIVHGLLISDTPNNMASTVGSSPWGTNGHLMLEVVPRASRAVAYVFPAHH